MAKLAREVVNALLVGPSADGRLVHDSPIRGDVWASLATSPGQRVDVLIEAYREVPTGLVATRLARRLYSAPERSGFAAPVPHDGFGISLLEGFLAARLCLKDIIYAVLPYTAWIRDSRVLDEDRDVEGELRRHVSAQLDAMRFPTGPIQDADPAIARLAATFRILAALDWATDHETAAIGSIQEFLNSIEVEDIAARAARFVGYARAMRSDMADDAESSDVDASDIFAVSRNRGVELALERSIPAVKADAVGTLFATSCSRIGWAVLDTGIDGDHPAFKDHARPDRSRVMATYDFTRLRRIVLIDHLFNARLLDANAARLAQAAGVPKERALSDLRELAERAQRGRPVDWSIAEPYVSDKSPAAPTNPHGTHVAGILGGCWAEEDWTNGAAPTARRGVCTDIRLYDFRVVGGAEDDTEFAVVGALQFIRHLNSRNNHLQIHGANISLSIRHDVRNYACGRTPVCEEAERAVASGVVVVAAAGNRGYQSYHLSDGGAFEAYAPSSITDPGNAEAVITVGSTHRSAPHSYGVSFFSSRGPTGDGRAKPDLVAPGEKIWSVVPHAGEDALSGTSMAAPHVSGAAALLMARNAEFVGQAATIKRVLCGSCTDLGRERSFQGAGMLDILRAMQSV